MRPTTRFKQLINAPELLMMPGVHDALSARIAKNAGFDAVTAAGFAATGALLGQPDSSQLSANEMADHYARICDAVDIPVFVDADTGFGNVTNVRRTVREFERAGVAGLFIEDQIFPKRCGHTPGKDVVPVEEFLGKLKSALDARRDPDFMIMARTDALGVIGLEEAISRGQMALDMGADIIFVEAPKTTDDMRRICTEIKAPHFANMVDFGDSPLLTAKELQNIGYAAAVWPVASVFTVTKALQSMYETLKRDGTTKAAQAGMVDFEDYTELVGLPELRDQEESYLQTTRDYLASRRSAAE
jgi:2-methylisocitrate lyase-like PEP mutase family enzyme